MEARILEFVRLLRRNGVRVSLGEDFDALEAALEVGVGSRSDLKVALASTMVKRSLDRRTFDELFDAFFAGFAAPLREAAARSQQASGLEGADFDELLAQLRELIEEQGQELSDRARDWLLGEDGRIESELRKAVDAVNAAGGQGGAPSSAPLTNALAQQMGLAQLLQEIEEFRDQVEADGEGEEPPDAALRRYLDQRLRELAELMKQINREQTRRGKPTDENRFRSIGDKSFYYLNEDEMREMRDAVAKLAMRLKSAISIRRRKARRGKFDLQGTLRKNLQHGGVPFDVRLRRRRRERPQIVILCDVSDSVRNASRFMLQFVYSLQGLYSRVRSFVFVAEPGEITRLFEELEAHDAIDAALNGDVINVYAHSDFGETFRRFEQDHLTVVNKRTTVIILGDARNNYNAPHALALRSIRDRAKRLIWLNPESKMTWGFGDSEMESYRAHCDSVEECRNLNQLYNVVDRLVATSEVR